MSQNYSFILDITGKYLLPPARLLDFGCGAADVAALALERGYDSYGADTFLGVGDSSQNHVIAAKKLGARAVTISPGAPMPFVKGFFDGVISNQVFEHVREIEKVSDEIARVVRPGGILLALMPTSEILWEDHLKMPLVHRAPPGSKRQRILMKGFRRIGLGTAKHMPDDDWVNIAVSDLQANVFHRSLKYYVSTFGRHFRLVAENEPAWARDRIKHHPLLKHGTRIADLRVLDGLLRVVVRRAAGAVLVFERLGETAKSRDVWRPT